LRFGLPILDFLDDLVVDFVLAMPSIAAAVGIGLGIAAFFACVPDCGSAGLALLGNSLALIHGPIPLPLLPKPRLQLRRLENVPVGCPLLVVGLVCVLPDGAAVACLEWALLTCKSTHDGDDWLWGGPVLGQ
jgi:hypothetical protein